MSRKQKTSGSDRQQFWQMVIETWQASGLSVRQFCKDEGLSEPSFYFWRKKLTKTDTSEPDSQKDTGGCGFIEVSIPGGNSSALELVLVSGNILRIGSSVDNEALNNVLSVLRGAGLC